VLSSPEFFRERADECLSLSYKMTNPKSQVAILKLANNWMRLAMATAEQARKEKSEGHQSAGV
jgi:hypothetical protein